jgi:glycosyltransferase involved in cell wall biosynthesis
MNTDELNDGVTTESRTMAPQSRQGPTDTIARLNVGFSLLTLFPGRVGGSETYAHGLLREFARGQFRDELTVLANRHVMSAYGPEFGDALRLHHVPSYRPGDSTATRAIAMAGARLTRRRVASGLPDGLDLIHYPVTVAIPRFNGGTVVTSHDLLHHLLPSALSRAERLYRRVFYDGAIRDAGHVVAPSHYLADTISERLGVPAERISAIPLGIDTGHFTPDPDERDETLAARLGLPERFILYPANLWPHKNHARLLEALARVTDRELALVLAGQDYGRLAQLEKQARGLGLADRVRHVGHLPADLVPALYRRAHAVVYPSLHENFGAPPLEAMGCGCPVAVSAAAALPETCADAAIAFDPERVEAITEAVELITGDASLRTRLRAAGLRHSRGFSWAEAASRHAAVYRRVAEGRV